MNIAVNLFYLLSVNYSDLSCYHLFLVYSEVFFTFLLINRDVKYFLIQSDS